MKLVICKHCNQSKTEASFYNDKHKLTGKKPRCKPCDKLSLDADNRRRYEKKYRKENPERRAAIVSKSMAGNAQHHKNKRREYFATDAGRATHRRYTQTRVAREKSAFVEVVCPKSLYLEQGGICYLCDGHFEFKDMHCDHVMPLSKGGLHEKKNCKMACRTCNLKKGAKVVIYQMV